MEDKKHDWTTAHAQLWTSFKKAQEEQGLREVETGVGVQKIPSINSLYRQHANSVRDVSSSILNEVTRLKNPGEPIFSDDFEGNIVSLIEDSATDPVIRELLTSIMHLKNRSENAAAETIYHHDSLIGVANEALLLLNGSKPEPRDERFPENTEALAEMEGRLFAILIEIEKSKELIKKISTRCSKPVCGDGSVRDLLDSIYSSLSSNKPLDSSNLKRWNDMGLYEKEILEQVMDILGAPSGTDPIMAADFALNVVKELEMVKRENDANFLLLQQYESTVLRKLASCGVTSPPTVKKERLTLLIGSENGNNEDEITCPSINDNDGESWIMKNLNELVFAMFEVNKNCGMNLVPEWLRTGPTGESAEENLKYMQTSLGVAKELLFVLARNEMESKVFLGEVIQKIIPHTVNRNIGYGDAKAGTIPLVTEQTLLEVVDNIGHYINSYMEQQQAQTFRQEEKHQTFCERGEHELCADYLTRIARWLPRDQLPDFAPPGISREEAMCQYIEEAVRSLVTASTVRPTTTAAARIVPLLEHLQNEIHKVAQSPSPVGSTTVAKLLEAAEEVRQWAAERRGGGAKTSVISNADDAIVRRALHELAQLLPTGSTSNSVSATAEIEPPVDNLPAMVRLLRQRQEQWVQEQQRQQLSAAQSRLEKSRLEEIMRERGQQLIKLTKEILHPGTTSEIEEVLGALDAELNEQTTTRAAAGATSGSGSGSGSGGGTTSSAKGNAASAPSPAALFDDLEERMKLIKSRHHRLFQSFSANRVRLENLIQSSTAHNRRWGRICGAVAGICRLVGMDSAAARLEKVAKTDFTSPQQSQASQTHTPQQQQTALVLRPHQHKANVVAPVSDNDVLETLRLVEERLRENAPLRDKAVAQSERARLLEVEQRWHEEATTFRQAMEMILLRLAETGRLLKRSLFMLGTDESAEDEVVESIMAEHRRRINAAAAAAAAEESLLGERAEGQRKKGQMEGDHATTLVGDGDNDNNTNNANGNNSNSDDVETVRRRQAASEEALASLLQKFGRWATRLHETTEDHLYTQQKLNGILPALDQVMNAAHSFKTESESSGEDGRTIGNQPQLTALSMLIQQHQQQQPSSMPSTSANGDHMLPSEPRLVRMYESVAKLRTMVAGLLSVRYLAIPTSSRRRASGDGAEELIFEDVWVDTAHVDLDSAGAAVASGDALVQAIEVNLTGVYQALGKFSTGYKLATILIQRDTEAMQQFISSMLEHYVELDIEQAFNQDSKVLEEMYVLLHERATRQRGCYFFSRVGGEGPCVWAAALEQLSVGFIGILDRLRRRTKAATEMREVLDDVVDLSAIYVNWIELTGLAASHPLPEDVLHACVRENALDGNEHGPNEHNRSTATVVTVEEETLAEEQQTKSGDVVRPPLPLPPQPQPYAKVSHFSRDAVVLKVMAHMLQLAQLGSSASNTNDINKNNNNNSGSSSSSTSSSSHSVDVPSKHKNNGGIKVHRIDGVADDSSRAQQLQLEEQIQVLRETTAVAAQRASRMEEERDKALSEAAISRAELRRWQRQSGDNGMDNHVNPVSIAPSPAPESGGNSGGSGKAHLNIKKERRVERSPPALTAAPGAELLFEAAQSMRELTAELRAAYQRAALPYPGAAPTPVAKLSAAHPNVSPATIHAEGHGNVDKDEAAAPRTAAAGKMTRGTSSSSPAAAAGAARRRVANGSPHSHRGLRRQTHGTTGLVRSPRSFARHRSLSPPSSSSSPLPPSSTRSHSPPAASIPCAVIVPNDATYAALATGKLRATASHTQPNTHGVVNATQTAPTNATVSTRTTRGGVGTTNTPNNARYRPGDHHGTFFDACDICSRRQRTSCPHVAPRKSPKRVTAATTTPLPVSVPTPRGERRGRSTSTAISPSCERQAGSVASRKETPTRRRGEAQRRVSPNNNMSKNKSDNMNKRNDEGGVGASLQMIEHHTDGSRARRAGSHPNIRTDALKKLADIVAKTKISGREEL